jgi:CheY-like chemotaxis protein
MMNNAEFNTLRKPIAVVVDDEPLILMDTSDIIADAGYSIVEATTADEAYAFLKEHSSVQLVVTDVQMPGKLDGFDLARNVSERWPDICVVVTSGAATPKDGDLPESVEFVGKPLSPNAVFAVLRVKGPHHSG